MTAVPPDLRAAATMGDKAPARPSRAGRAHLAASVLLAAAVLAVLLPFAGADPPTGLTGSNAPFTDEGFNLANARNRVLFGRFGVDDVDRSLTNGAYSTAAAAVFRVTGPRLAVGRALSMACTAAAVLLLAQGLARPFGRPAALLAAVALGGADLALEYGRLGLVEPMVVALLTAAFVVVVRSRPRPSVPAGALAGLLVAAAVSVKATALLPGVVLLGVPLAPALRERTRLGAALAGPVAAAAAGLAWLSAVALPNADRLRTALRIWPSVHYPHSPGALAARLGAYLAHSDQALGRSAPLLAAAGTGLVAAAAGWRSLDPSRREALVMAAGWGIGLWAAIAVGDYAPNRYVVPALPGLAVLAGFGLATVAGAASRAMPRGRRPGVAAAAVAVLLGLAVAGPGAARFLAGSDPGASQRVRDQRALAAAAGPDATVYGAYAPTLLFDTRLRVVEPWPPAHANLRDPVGRFGVTHVLAGGPGDPTRQVPAFRSAGRLVPVARVPWAGQAVWLYEVRTGTAGTPG